MDNHRPHQDQGLASMTPHQDDGYEGERPPLIQDIYSPEEIYEFVFKALMSTEADSIYIKDPTGRLNLINQCVVVELNANDEEEIIGKTDIELFGEEFGLRTQKEEQSVYESGEPLKDLVEVRHDKPDSNYWTYTTKIPLRDQEGKIIGLIGFTRNINRLKSTETKLRRLASHDQLTNVYNRYGLFERLHEMIQPSGAKLAVLFLDVDNFKIVNDQYFHKAGDEYLKWLAWLLKSTARGNDIVARVGGDEFVIILDNILHIDDAKKFCEKLQKNYEDSLEERFKKLNIGFSIGISIFPDDAQNSEELIEKADLALYCVKQTNKGDVKFFRDFRQFSITN